MNREQTPKSPAAKTGLFAPLSDLFRFQGSSAPPSRLLVLLALAIVTALALSAPAFAAPPPSFGGPEGEGAGELGNPRGIAVDQESGDTYVSDRGINRIDRFGPDGQFILAWGWGVVDGNATPQTCTATCFAGLAGSGPGQINDPQGIAVDNSGGASQGDIYVDDTQNHRIDKFGPAGDFILTFGGEVNKSTTEDVCTAASGDECGAGVAGTSLGSFERLGPYAVAVGPFGDVFVADQGRVQKFGPTGVAEGEISLPGTGDIRALAVDSASNIYLITELSGVRKYDGAGIELGGPRDPTLNSFASTIAIDQSDDLIVSDSESRHVLTFDPAGALRSSLYQTGPNTSQPDGGVTFGDSQGRLFILYSSLIRTTVLPASETPFVLPTSVEAVEIQPASATLNATLNPEGGEETKYHFEYGTEAGVYDQSTVPAELSGGPFEDQLAAAAIAGLQPSTTYHFRVVAANKAGQTATGPDREFTTLPSVSILSTSASQVTSTSAVLEAELNPHGLPTEFQFDYGTSTAYGSVAPILGADAGAGTEARQVSVTIQGLQPGLVYHYRVRAQNELGAVVGPDREFSAQAASNDALLPDGRAWELVSPSSKGGMPLEAIAREGAVIQAAADGNGLTYAATGSIDKAPAGNRSVAMSQLLANRAEAGWDSHDISSPHEAPVGLTAGERSEYKFFSSDLSLGALESMGATPLSPATTERTPYLHESSGAYQPLVTANNVFPGVQFGGTARPSGLYSGGVHFITATPDLRSVLLESSEALTEGVATGELNSIFLWHGGTLTLASVLPNGQPATAEGLEARAGAANNLRGAISSDGTRVVFATTHEGVNHIYIRDMNTEQTAQVDAPETAAKGGAGELTFQLANAAGTRVFFTDESRLTTNSTARPGDPDLYMCETNEQGGHLGCDLTDLSIDTHPGQAADVQGEVIGSSQDGSVVYFVANGELAPGAVAGDCALTPPYLASASASCNLYRTDVTSGATSLVGVLSNRDSNDWAASGGNNLNSLTARSSSNGRFLAFMSQRSLTGYDNRDAHSEAPDEEVYLYDAEADGGAGGVRCASCNPTGARPDGIFDPGVFPGLLVDHPELWARNWLAGSVPGWTSVDLGHALYQSRYLSDSGRLFFNSADALSPGDSNGLEDVYQYELPSAVGQPASNSCSEASSTYSPVSHGCLSLISSGSSGEESTFLDASESGDDVFFLTASRLTPQDSDKALDIYDARVDGGFPVPVKPVECGGDACQQPAIPPNDPTPNSLTFSGSGNVLQCPKGKVKSAGKCVKKQGKKKHHKKKLHKKHKKSKRANTNRGGAK